MREIKGIKDYLSFMENENLRQRATKINDEVGKLLDYSEKILDLIEKSETILDIETKAYFLQKETSQVAGEVRKISDTLEKLISRENYSMPNYVDMLKTL